jgi:anti-anti-sigma factor
MSHAASTSLRFERRNAEPMPVLTVVGDLDAATAGDFAAAAGATIALEKPSCLVVDLAGVRFLDSTGLNEIVRAHREMHRTGGRLVLRSPGEMVRLLLAVTRLSGHIEIE